MTVTVTNDSYSTGKATDLVVGQELDFQQSGSSAAVTVEGKAGELNVGTPVGFNEQGSLADVSTDGFAGTAELGFIVGGAVSDKADVDVTGFAGSVLDVAAEADFDARSSQSGVVWFHGFDNDDEVNNFRLVGGYGSDRPDAVAIANPGTGWVRRVTSDPAFPNGCMEINWPTDLISQGYTWWRPLAPFTGTINGRGVDDPGAGITPKTDLDPDSVNHWSTGSKYSWSADAYAATLGANYLGREFYLQYRLKLPLSRVTQVPGGKCIYLDGPSSNNQELVQQVGGSPGATASSFSFYTNFGSDSRSNVNLYEPQTWGLNSSNAPNLNDWNTRYSTSLTVRNRQPGSDVTTACEDGATTCATCWCMPADEWVTFLMRVVPGQGSSIGEGWGGGGPNATQMLDSLDDPAFEKTQVTVWAAASNLPNGAEAYTKVWDKKDYIWSFDGDNPYGFSVLKFSNYSNLVATTADTYHRMAQPIHSKQPILCPRTTPTALEQRTRDLTSADMPVLNDNYFRSEEGAVQIPNNRTASQGSEITWQVQGIYYDPIRRRMHQCDRQHSSTHTEHAYLDEVTNTWVLVDTSIMDGSPPGHWRAADLDPSTGVIYWRREGSADLYIYDPDVGASGTWRFVTSTLDIASGDGGNAGFHPNLFGPGVPGILTGRYATTQRFVAFKIADETWHDMSQSGQPAGSIGDVLFRGWSAYLAERDELIMTKSSGPMVAFAAGSGLETDISLTNSAENRSSIIAAGGKAIHPINTATKSYACIHPRDPNTILAMDCVNSNVYYTKDGASTAWQLAPFTHPFSSELTDFGYNTVGCLPHHGVVVGSDTISDNNTRSVYWRPPLV